MEGTMPEARPAPIATPTAIEVHPGAEPVKSLPDLQKPFDSMFAEVLPAARDATILKQTPQPYETDQRLAAISDPNKKKQLTEALASAGEKAVKAVDTQEQFDKAIAAGTAEKDSEGKIYTGKFKLKAEKPIIGPDGKETYPETEGNVTTSTYTDAIRGVKSVIAGTEGSVDLKQQELNKKAKETLDGIRSNVRVDTAAEKDIPLEVWEQRVNQKALELWKADNPSGTEAEYADPTKVSLLAKHAYQLRAETELDPQAKYKLIYAETPSPQTLVAEEARIEARERIFTQGKNILRDLIADYDERTLDEILKDKNLRLGHNTLTATLAIYVDKLSDPNLDPAERRYIGTAIHGRLTDLAQAGDPSALSSKENRTLWNRLSKTSQDQLKTYLKDARTKGHPINQEIETVHHDIEQNIISHIYQEAAQKGIRLTNTVTYEHIFRNASIAAVIRQAKERQGRLGRLGKKIDLKQTLNQLRGEELRMNFNDADEFFIETLVNEESGGYLNRFLDRMGTTDAELGDVPEYMKKHADHIVEITKNEEDGRLASEQWVTIKAKRVQSLNDQTQNVVEKVMKSPRFSKGNLFMAFMCGAMGFSMVAPVLGFDAKEEGGQPTS